MDYENLLQELSFLKYFCIYSYVPAHITSLSFIGFRHISNRWKAEEVSYEFSVASFLEQHVSMVKNTDFPRLLQSVSTDLQRLG
jgi:hypothetical protein